MLYLITIKSPVELEECYFCMVALLTFPGVMFDISKAIISNNHTRVVCTSTRSLGKGKHEDALSEQSLSLKKVSGSRGLDSTLDEEEEENLTSFLYEDAIGPK